MGPFKLPAWQVGVGGAKTQSNRVGDVANVNVSMEIYCSTVEDTIREYI